MAESIETRGRITVRELNNGAICISGVGADAAGVQFLSGIPNAYDLMLNTETIVAVKDATEEVGSDSIHVSTVDGHGWLMYGSYKALVEAITSGRSAHE